MLTGVIQCLTVQSGILIMVIVVLDLIHTVAEAKVYSKDHPMFVTKTEVRH